MTGAEKLAEVRRVLILTFVGNLTVAAAKGAYGAVSGSLAVASDAVHSLLDAASNIVGWVTTRAAADPPDAEHPYGHHKIEIIAATFLGVLIAGGALQFLWSAISALATAAPAPVITIAGFVIIGGTLVVNVVIAAYEAKQGKALNSPFLSADAAHTASDIVVTLGVLVSLGLSRMGLAWADPVAALFVLAVIAKVAWEIISANVSILLDQAFYDPDKVRAMALAVDGVTGCHRVRSRGTAGSAHLDLHIQVDGDVTLRQAHDISHAVENTLRTGLADLVDVTIHVEPHDDEEEGL